jgi:hypothetical protein
LLIIPTRESPANVEALSMPNVTALASVDTSGAFVAGFADGRLRLILGSEEPEPIRLGRDLAIQHPVVAIGVSPPSVSGQDDPDSVIAVAAGGALHLLDMTASEERAARTLKLGWTPNIVEVFGDRMTVAVGAARHFDILDKITRSSALEKEAADPLVSTDAFTVADPVAISDEGRRVATIERGAGSRIEIRTLVKRRPAPPPELA